jgi:hypothetical protein
MSGAINGPDLNPLLVSGSIDQTTGEVPESPGTRSLREV